MENYRDMSIEELVGRLEQERLFVDWCRGVKAQGSDVPRALGDIDEAISESCRRLAQILANLAAKGKYIQAMLEESELPF